MDVAIYRYGRVRGVAACDRHDKYSENNDMVHARTKVFLIILTKKEGGVLLMSEGEGLRAGALSTVGMGARVRRDGFYAHWR